MKRSAVLSTVVLFLFLIPSIASGAAVCQSFPYWDMRHTKGTLTAAVVNPKAPVTGEIDATGCDVGVYYGVPGAKGLVQNARIHGATLYGVLVSGMAGSLSVDVVSSSIHDIGLSDPSLYVPELGGAAIAYLTEMNPLSGKITDTVLSRYATAGVYFSYGDVEITDNIISGLTIGSFSEHTGRSGILARGRAIITDNTITGHVYTGPGDLWIASGIRGTFFPGSRISRNVLVNNQIGMFIGNEGEMVSSVTVADNRITCDALYAQATYQIGLWMYGTRDKVTSNVITGFGYDATTKPYFTFPTWGSVTDPRGKDR